ncbi:MAG TPA: DUF4965 domain-containing protein [Armatimonadota bacterium]|jgi:hypothetical protein
MLITKRLAVCAALAVSIPAWGQTAFRPPSVPLVANNPFLSIWSSADRLTDATTVHWTNRAQPLSSIIKVDGKSFRLMGADPENVEAMPQVGLEVTPTRTIYRFATEQVDVTLTFLTASLPDDLEVFARPLTYLTWKVRSIDGQSHAVSLFDSTSTLLAVNTPREAVGIERGMAGSLSWLRAGTDSQPVLRSSGDDHRIDWGYVYVASAIGQGEKAVAGGSQAIMSDFTGSPITFNENGRQPTDPNQTALAFAFDLGKVSAEPVTRQVILAYDEIYSIRYFGTKLRPYWRRNGATPEGLLRTAYKEFPGIEKRCVEFDRDITADAERLGGAKYAQLCALAYRQSLAACGIAADAKKQPLYFPKENSSNGCIATVDVIYPGSPLLLLVSPSLLKAQLTPVLDYAASPRWKWSFAPHDLGTYPIAGGQVYGGGERTEENQMPVEESGDMLLMIAGLAKTDGNARYAGAYWPTLTKWANYLREKGLDPENQLCTDDFAGHLAHNVNLSAKAILALASYARMAEMLGKQDVADDFFASARSMAKEWVRMAADGDHTRLAFDKPGTWSQKYNLVWDRLLGLDIFPASVARQELAFYRTVMQRYGVPLDSRRTYTKTDWELWTATMAEKREDLDAIVAAAYDSVNDTRSRVPFTDWYETTDAREAGFRARSVIGGIFIKMMSDDAVWKKWAGRDKAKVGKWAPLPTPPEVKEVVPTSERTPVMWRYTTAKPADDWASPAFDASGWTEGPGGFGSRGTPGAVAGTAWNTDDIWLRREFTMPEGRFRALKFSVYHDEDVEIYVNGVPAASEAGYVNAYTWLDISPAAAALLKPGAKITLAAHCHQTTGGQGIDVGLVDVLSGGD